MALDAEWVKVAASALVFGMVIPATLFPLLYWKWFPWWKQPLGRALMAKATGLMLLVNVSVAYSIFGDDYPGRELVKFGVFALVLTGLWYELVVLIKIRRSGDRRRSPDQDPEADTSTDYPSVIERR